MRTAVVFSRPVTSILLTSCRGCTATYLPNIPCHKKSTRSETTTTQSQGRSSGRKKGDLADKKMVAIRDILYAETLAPPHPPHGLPADLDTSHIKEVTETIERAWAMRKIDEQQEIMREVKRKYSAMRRAMEALEVLDRRLFDGALKHNKVERGTSWYSASAEGSASTEGSKDDEVAGIDVKPVVVFPRRLRVPTETPPLKGWNYKVPNQNQ